MANSKKTIKVTDIVEGNRGRVKYDKIESLAESINQFGLLQPIVVDKDLTLVAGCRRLHAIKKLGWTELEWGNHVKSMGELSELELKEMELEENLQRENLSWEEEVNMRHEIHVLKLLKHKGSRTLEETAEDLGIQKGSLSQDINLAKGLTKYPELRKQKTKVDAFKELRRIREREVRGELMKRRMEDDSPLEHIEFHHGDCREHSKKLKDNSVDLHLTDPPWMIDVATAEAITKSFGSLEYKDDDEEAIKVVLSEVYPEMYRTLKEGGHALIFFAIQHYEWHKQALAHAGFEVDELPFVWSRGRFGSRHDGARFVNTYEVALHCWKGTPVPLPKQIDNLYYCRLMPSEEKIHSAEKPVELYERLIEACTEPGELVADFFAGSGAVLEASLNLGRDGWGVELLPDVYHKAYERLQKKEVEQDVEDSPGGGTE